VTCALEFCPLGAISSRAPLFEPLFMRLRATFLNRQLPYSAPGYTRLVRTELAGKPNGPKQQENTLRGGDNVLG
jgi:hypothetical protein